MILETERLHLREMAHADFPLLCKHVQDAEVMYAYDRAFSDVMQNAAGESVDVHAFEYDKNGKNTYGVEFPFGSLTGKGQISGQEVKCVSPE